jgi:ornithine cyclodeaminase
MTEVYTLEQIKTALVFGELVEEIEKGFVLYSEGKTVVPPVGYLGFENPPADVHIKYGYIRGDDFYVVKIASGFYENPKIGLPSSNGLMLVFSQQTGELKAILLDEGYLTDIRTAVAGAVAAKYLAPKIINCIGIVGSGVQARLQLRLLKEVTTCRSVIVWGRASEKLEQYKKEMTPQGFEIETTKDISDVTENCRLIVTTTPSTAPLLFAGQIKKGTHITAVGADAPGKQELDARIFGIADLIVADSLEQCLAHGDLASAGKNGVIPKTIVWELGKVISRPGLRRKNDDQITVADLTGVAVQDIQIAKYVHSRLPPKDGINQIL